MTNKEKLHEVLCKTFKVSEEELAGLAFGGKNWDSIGHIQMITELEGAFGISVSPDDMVKMGTYDDVMKVLTESYGVDF